MSPEPSSLGTRIDNIEGSAMALSRELGGIQVTAHEKWSPSSGVHNVYDLSTVIDQHEGEEIPETGPNDACFISSLNWASGDGRGRRLVKMVQPINDSSWRIIALHSFQEDNKPVNQEWVQAQVMCIRLPDPTALQGINLSEAG